MKGQPTLGSGIGTKRRPAENAGPKNETVVKRGMEYYTLYTVHIPIMENTPVENSLGRYAMALIELILHANIFDIRSESLKYPMIILLHNSSTSIP